MHFYGCNYAALFIASLPSPRFIEQHENFWLLILAVSYCFHFILSQSQLMFIFTTSFMRVSQYFLGAVSIWQHCTQTIVLLTWQDPSSRRQVWNCKLGRSAQIPHSSGQPCWASKGSSPSFTYPSVSDNFLWIQHGTFSFHLAVLQGDLQGTQHCFIIAL